MDDCRCQPVNQVLTHFDRRLVLLVHVQRLQLCVRVPVSKGCIFYLYFSNKDCDVEVFESFASLKDASKCQQVYRFN